jgi:DNA-directed RNA polymerase specialized sigma24 family protein
VIDEPYAEEPLPVFDTLAAKELETVNLYIDGLKVKEIAEKLGEPANRVAVRMKRIKERLAKSKNKSQC